MVVYSEYAPTSKLLRYLELASPILCCSHVPAELLHISFVTQSAVERIHGWARGFYMSHESFFDLARDNVRGHLAEFTGKWGWYFALGVFLVILGFLASGMAVTTTILSTVALGWILLGAGAGLVLLSFLTGKWSGFLLTLAAGILSIIAGFEILSYPLAGAVAINMIIGTMLLVTGIFRLIASIAMRFPNWGWAFISGIAAFALGGILLRNWQSTSLWFLGFAIGIDLILHGISWMAFSVEIHRLAGALRISESERRAA